MKTAVYLRLEPRFYSSGKLHSVRVVGVTQRRPSDLPGVSMRLELDVPDAVFLPLGPVLVELEPGDLTVNVHVGGES